MHIEQLPFGTIDWSQIERTEHKGASGTACWRTRQFGEIRYGWLNTPRGIWLIIGAGRGTSCCAGRGAAYRAGRWSHLHFEAGHELSRGDDAEAPRSSTKTGATLFIVD